MKTIDNSIVDGYSILLVLKILENAEPAEVLEKPVLLCDGRWLTGEEVAEYAEALSGYPEDNWSTE